MKDARLSMGHRALLKNACRRAVGLGNARRESLARTRQARRSMLKIADCGQFAVLQPGVSSWQSLATRLSSRGEIMDKAEIVKLREFLRRSFGAPTLQVAPNSKSAEAADVSLGERKLGTITVDDEDGDRSFAFAMKLPVGRPVLQDYLRRLFENDKLTIAGRLKKTDSVELNNGPDFLGVVSADDSDGSTFTLQMAILDVDLDDEE
jgi:hypothetical protein